MENKKLKKNVPVELNDAALEAVIGGANLDEIRGKCTQLGIDFDALYADIEKLGADLEPRSRDARIIGQLVKNGWERGRNNDWYTTDIVNALREKYPLDL